MDQNKILLVDDEQDILNSLERELLFEENDLDLEILTTNKPKKVLEMLNENPDVCVIISDFRMPEINGADLLLEVKKAYPEIVTIMLTAYSDPDAVKEIVKAGIFSYIKKPWEKEDLFSKIMEAIELYKTKIQKRQFHQMLKEELKWAAQLQKRLIASDIPVSDKIQFHVTYQPLPELQCGGDYYTIAQLDSEKYLIIIADVVGHGVRAAFITLILRSIIFDYVRKQ